MNKINIFWICIAVIYLIFALYCGLVSKHWTPMFAFLITTVAGLFLSRRK